MYYALVRLCSEFFFFLLLLSCSIRLRPDSHTDGFCLIRLERTADADSSCICGMGSFFIDFDLDVGQRQHGRFLSQCIYAVQLFSFVLYQSKKPVTRLFVVISLVEYLVVP